MTAHSAWRPLSEAPKTHVPVAVIGRGVPNIGIAFYDTVGACWRLRGGFEPQLSQEGSDVIFAPIADTLELDRAVQVKVAEAFGVLIEAMKDSYFNRSHHAREFLQHSGVVNARHILHVAFGGRIPDEVPNV